jgi:hypothetical protein
MDSCGRCFDLAFKNSNSEQKKQNILFIVNIMLKLYFKVKKIN